MCKIIFGILLISASLAELIGYSPSYVRAVVSGKLNSIENVQSKINDVLNIKEGGV